MKSAIFFILLFSSIGLWAQTGSLPANDTCSNPRFLCSSTYQDTTFTDTYSSGSFATLFYYFQAGTGTSVSDYCRITSCTRIKAFVYGPFSSDTNFCTGLTLVEETAWSTYAPPLYEVSLNQDLTPGSWYLLVLLAASSSYEECGITITAEPNTMVCGEDSTDVADVPCEDCIGAFQPKNGTYILSAWVKEQTTGGSAETNYNNSKIVVTGGSGPEEFFPSGQIIDGWQRIEGVFTASSTGAISVELVCSSGEAYFDDIRIFPYDGSMMSYVYDPITRRLMAELDERNYAKLYEYDEEGKLVRVKKETEKGIMTIQENRENNSKE